MNYDDWKLATPDYAEMVSHCCGTEYNEDDDGHTCLRCGEECETVDEREYDVQQKEALAEMRMDEERLERD